MKRFQHLIRQARGDTPPWFKAPLTAAQIDTVARLLEPADVTEVLDWLDHLADEKAMLPEWDGDSADDIAGAQHDLARLLAAAPAARPVLDGNAIATRSEDTSRWLGIAIDARDGA